MKITIAKTAGFCMGVRRAVELSLDASNSSNEPICSYGPLIHNPQVLALLGEKGMSVIDRIPESGYGTVLVRAHGIPPQVKIELAEAGFTVIDATCPRVIRVQTIIRKHAAKGHAVIIIGDDDHPEVVGLLGYAGERGYAVNSLDGLKRLPEFERAIVVAQTTQNTHFYDSIRHWITDHFPHYKIYNTICDSTEKRQAEVAQLAQNVDAMVVVGGYNSGNTQRMVEVAKESGTPAFHIESEADLDSDTMAGFDSVAITAGASTPNWVINTVHRRLETLPYDVEKSWRRFILPFQQALLYTNVYVALGAGGLTFAGTLLQGLGWYLPQMLIAFLYVLSMHTFNHLTGRKSDRYNDPERAEFYERNRAGLYGIAVVAGAAGLAIVLAMGAVPFIVLLIMSILGALYNVKVLPSGIAGNRRQALKDIPGSKTVLIGIAWGVVTVVLPSLTITGGISFVTVGVFFWVAGVVFVRTLFFDVLDRQGDRVVGQPTLPLMLGEKRTHQLLMFVSIAVVVLLLLITAVAGKFFLGLVIGSVTLMLPAVIAAHDRGAIAVGVRLSFLVESTFVMAGGVAVIGTVLGLAG
jgi:(E)-4-hydroxy-3-methyl-but-2-enyl pyrophosphate reductase